MTSATNLLAEETEKTQVEEMNASLREALEDRQRCGESMNQILNRENDVDERTQEWWNGQIVEMGKNLMRHPSSEAFHQCLRECADLHDRKQEDYGTNEDPFANVRSTEQFGVPAWLGAVIRGNDKVARLKTYAKKGTLVNEGVEDSLKDLANYALIALVLFREQNAAQ